MGSERMHGLSTEQFPVSAYVGSSKYLKDLEGSELSLGAYYLCPLGARESAGPHESEAPSQDPSVGLCLGPYGGPARGGGSYERGIPVCPLGTRESAGPLAAEARADYAGVTRNQGHAPP